MQTIPGSILVLKEFFKQYAPTVKMWRHKRSGFVSKYQKPPKRNTKIAIGFTEADKEAIAQGLQQFAEDVKCYIVSDITGGETSLEKRAYTSSGLYGKPVEMEYVICNYESHSDADFLDFEITEGSQLLVIKVPNDLGNGMPNRVANVPDLPARLVDAALRSAFSKPKKKDLYDRL